jgi:hypothetical protein
MRAKAIRRRKIGANAWTSPVFFGERPQFVLGSLTRKMVAPNIGTIFPELVFRLDRMEECKEFVTVSGQSCVAL